MYIHSAFHQHQKKEYEVQLETVSTENKQLQTLIDEMNGEGGDILTSKRRIQHIQSTSSANDPETPNHTVDSIILQSPNPSTTKTTTTTTTNSASSNGDGVADVGDTNLSALTPPPPPTIPTISSTLQHAISTINMSKSQFQAEYTALCDQHNLSAEVQVATQELLSTFLGSHMSQLVQEYEDKNRYNIQLYTCIQQNIY